MIKLLVLTTLYPNSEQFRHGIFVETRLLKLLATNEFDAEVIAPVPWFPFRAERFGLYGTYARIPKQEVRNGVTVHHPRYLVIPKVGMLLTPFFLALSFLLCIARLKKRGLQYDLVDAHYYYPDGVAVALLKRFLSRPIAVTARGTDLNLIPEYSIPRKLILWATKTVDATITVSCALRERLVDLGAQPDKIHVLQNGVDLDTFKPMDREACRQKWKVTGPTLLSVGNLVELKGHHLVVEALEQLPQYHLLIVGDGEYRKQLQEQVKGMGLQDRVRFLGALPREDVVEIYNAADLLILASSREGMPNVLLESIACGTPVISTDVGGASEVVTSKELGFLLNSRTAASIVNEIRLYQQAPLDRCAVREQAVPWSWSATVDRIKTLFEEINRRCFKNA